MRRPHVGMQVTLQLVADAFSHRRLLRPSPLPCPLAGPFSAEEEAQRSWEAAAALVATMPVPDLSSRAFPLMQAAEAQVASFGVVDESEVLAQAWWRWTATQQQRSRSVQP